MQILVKGKTIKEVELKLGEAIKKANLYYNKNSLLNNTTKTEIMLLTTRHKLNQQKDFKVKVSDGNTEEYIYGQEYLKILGILIDQTLSWDKQISNIKKKANNAIRNVHRANHLLPMKQKRVLYDSLITPHFTYGDIIWNSCGKENSNKLQQAQNYAAKSMLGVNRYSSSNEALKKLELLPLHEKRNIHTAVFVKKVLDGNAPEEVKTMFDKQKRPANLRPGNLQLPKHKTHLYEKGPLYTALKVWNSVPSNLKSSNQNLFKQQLQKR